MKGKIVLIQFPFDDLAASKVRPAYALTETIGMYEHIIFALITSRMPKPPLATDILLESQHPDFGQSGLQKPSTLRLDHVVTLRQSMIRRELGALSATTQAEIAQILCALLST
jgi:mRNA interferase MazF